MYYKNMEKQLITIINNLLSKMDSGKENTFKNNNLLQQTIQNQIEKIFQDDPIS
jgi:hypothetical protein